MEEVLFGWKSSGWSGRVSGLSRRRSGCFSRQYGFSIVGLDKVLVFLEEFWFGGVLVGLEEFLVVPEEVPVGLSRHSGCS